MRTQSFISEIDEMRQTPSNVEHCSGPEGKKRRGPIESCTYSVSKQRTTPRDSALKLLSLTCGCWICVSTSDLNCSRQQACPGPAAIRRRSAYRCIFFRASGTTKFGSSSPYRPHEAERVLVLSQSVTVVPVPLIYDTTAGR